MLLFYPLRHSLFPPEVQEVIWKEGEQILLEIVIVHRTGIGYTWETHKYWLLINTFNYGIDRV